jgi:hypothetical protein
MDDATINELNQLGEVIYIVAPNFIIYLLLTSNCVTPMPNYGQYLV